MKRFKTQYAIYFTLVVLFAIAVLVFQIYRWSYGHYIYDPNDHAWDVQIRTSQSTATVISFLFSTSVFIYKMRRRFLDKDNILYLFLSLNFLADVLSSSLNLQTAGYIARLASMLCLILFWRPKKFEIIFRLVIIAGVPFIYYLIYRTFVLDDILVYEIGYTSLVNVIFASINYKKNKSYFSLYLLLGVSFMFLHQALVALRTVTYFSRTVSNIFAILVWPVYTTELIYFNQLYRKY